MIKIITRSDDAGSSKGANQAIFEAVNHPFVKNISLMAPGHYIEEAAQYLKDKKHICLGMHFTMNAEWDNVKWGPVSPAEDVGAMLDASGNFLAEPKLSSANGVTIEMIRKEWNAQLDRLTRLGLDIRYADGSRKTIFTDESWKASNQGPVTANSMYYGEVYDARKEQPGYNLPGFDDAGWEAASPAASKGTDSFKGRFLLLECFRAALVILFCTQTPA